MTKEAIINALTVDMALGCSTNSMLHLPAIAHEIGFDFDIAYANEISAKTPNLCHLAPAGPTYMEDLNEAGGVYAVMNQLSQLGLLNESCMTVTGKTIGENIKGVKNNNPEVIRLLRCLCMKDLHVCLNVRKMRLRQSKAERLLQGMWLSSDMKDQREDPVCVKCSIPLRQLPAWDWDQP